nr:hypothetical protein [Lactiplantibacillus plantarum]
MRTHILPNQSQRKIILIKIKSVKYSR